MPKSAAYTLTWSEESKIYVLLSPEHPPQIFDPECEERWFAWLTTHPSFSFQGRCGHLNVLKEARKRGAGYWYAYHTVGQRARKRYLGRMANLSLVYLEQVAQELGRAPASRPQTKEARPCEGRSVWLSARLSAPHVPDFLVERSRLFRKLDAACSYPLTLVSAPAGSGKTTLLAAWAATFSSPVRYSSKGEAAARELLVQGRQQALAWLSLEELDNEPIRFWDVVIAALRTCFPRLGEAVLALLHASQSPPLSTVVLHLLKEVEQAGKELILILDDYHLLSERSIHDSMSFFLDHLPANAHLILLTRVDPDLPLARLRVRSQLLEIRDHDLYFTQQEAASFLLQARSLSLSEEEVAALHQRTRGWIAGLQLAALSLARHEDISTWIANFGGSHRYLVDYVQQDILEHLPDTLQDFLLQTSILTHLNADLCQAVTLAPSRQACQKHLEQLERANLFLVPLDAQRQWYCYHDLFREALGVRLRISQPERMPDLHRRAARWYEIQGELREAINHALTVPDYTYAADLMEHAAPRLFRSGEARTISNWILSLPNSALCEHTSLALTATLHLLNASTIQLASVSAEIKRVSTRLETVLHSVHCFSSDERSVIERRLRLLQAWVEIRNLRKRGETERALQLVQELETLPPDAEVNWNLIPLFLSVLFVEYFPHTRDLWIPRLLLAKQQAMQAGFHPSTVRVVVLLAQMYVQTGQLRQARRECLEAFALIEQYDVHTCMTGFLYLNLFEIAYAQNRLEEAERCLPSLLHCAREWDQTYLLALGETCMVRLALARGDLASAQQALQRMEVLIEQEGYTHFVLWQQLIRVNYWLASGNQARAQEWATQQMRSLDAGEHIHSEEILILLQVLLAQKQFSQALELLARSREQLEQSADVHVAWFLALSVAVLSKAGKCKEARREAARLLALTELEGNLRVYLDAGLPMKQALTMLLEAPLDDKIGIDEVVLSRSSLARILAAFEQGEQRLARKLDAPAVHHSARQLPPALSSSLSRQEQRVLRLLLTGQTYAEIARELVVSPNTVKTQVNSIYRKLGVSRRAEAIAQAARLGLP